MGANSLGLVCRGSTPPPLVPEAAQNNMLSSVTHLRIKTRIIIKKLCFFFSFGGEE